MTQDTYLINICSSYLIFNETQGYSLLYEEVIRPARFTLQRQIRGVKV
jgi:hypothetical protein